MSPRVPVCQQFWDYLPLSAGAGHGPGVSQSEQGPRLRRAGTNIIGGGPASADQVANIAQTLHADNTCSTAVTVTNFMWSDDIKVVMMSMKLPSNEEMKKWNVDQVQEFLAQV